MREKKRKRFLQIFQTVLLSTLVLFTAWSSMGMGCKPQGPCANPTKECHCKYKNWVGSTKVCYKLVGKGGEACGYDPSNCNQKCQWGCGEEAPYKQKQNFTY